MQAYGQTELSPIATILHWKEHIGEGRRRDGIAGPGGRRSVEVKIVDADDKQVPQGTPARSWSGAITS